MEANPGTLTKENLAGYRRAGINRLSLGCQSTDDAELKLLGRIHTWAQFQESFRMAREAGFTNLNVDLMSGLPGQHLASWEESLETIARMEPEHISAYSLIIEEGTPFAEKTLELPDEEEERQMYERTGEILQSYGYQQYEISNYAREDYACYHNKVYWQRKNYLGLGIGAASMVDNRRMTNISDIYGYMETCETLEQMDTTQDILLQSVLWQDVTELSKKDAMEEFMFLGLRMNEGVTRAEFQRQFSCSIESVYGEVIKRLREEQLLVMAEGRIFLTEKGMDLSNYALAQFLL